ncbi:uncharacterized protein YneF (UPF0154 family) [Hymenobacter sp. UYP22]
MVMFMRVLLVLFLIIGLLAGLSYFVSEAFGWHLPLVFFFWFGWMIWLPVVLLLIVTCLWNLGVWLTRQFQQ